MPQKKIFRFGAFEADPGRGELRTSGMRLRFEEQPFQTLLMLVGRPGDVSAAKNCDKSCGRLIPWWILTTA